MNFFFKLSFWLIKKVEGQKPLTKLVEYTSTNPYVFHYQTFDLDFRVLVVVRSVFSLIQLIIQSLLQASILVLKTFDLHL